MQRDIAQQVMDHLPKALSHVEEFEHVLRPAFEQDEWKLIAFGAILRFMVGEMQVFLVEHLTH